MYVCITEKTVIDEQQYIRNRHYFLSGVMIAAMGSLARPILLRTLRTWKTGELDAITMGIPREEIFSRDRSPRQIF